MSLKSDARANKQTHEVEILFTRRPIIFIHYSADACTVFINLTELMQSYGKSITIILIDYNLCIYYDFKINMIYTVRLFKNSRFLQEIRRYITLIYLTPKLYCLCMLQLRTAIYYNVQ